ncbi:Invasin [Klebsiella pneumoniae]|nr:Invasin [Klebsiella pneumoniae]
MTVTLKDAAGSAVTGAASSLTADAVTVANATLKSGSSWTDNNDGTYTGTFTATTAGTGLKASLKLTDWTDKDESAAYAITAGKPDRAQSAIAVDKTTYTSGDDMTVTVTLKDKGGNALTGAASSLTADAVTVANATLKSGSSWTDNKDGSYKATYVAGNRSLANKATLVLPDWSTGQAVSSEDYNIYGTATLGNISANGATFANNVNFPTTGFVGATFTLGLTSSNGSQLADYDWSANVSWVTVTDGTIILAQEPPRGITRKVTVTGVPKGGYGQNNQAKNIVYTFTISNWFLHNAGILISEVEASATCANFAAQVPTPDELTNTLRNTVPGGKGEDPVRQVGSLWGEWGPFNDGYSWTSVIDPTAVGSPNQYYVVNLFNGWTDYPENAVLTQPFTSGVMCVQHQ